MGKTKKKKSGSKEVGGKTTEKKSLGRRIWEFIYSWSTVIIMVLAIRAFGIESMIVPTGSMESTILPGDFVLVNKFVYGFKAPFTNADIIPGRMPRPGDIIVFRYPRHPRWARPYDRYKTLFPREFMVLPLHWDSKGKKLHWFAPENWVKRCVGIPGDTVEIINKRLYINGKRFAYDGRAVHYDRAVMPALLPREEFSERWMDLLCFQYADSLYYADSSLYLNHASFGKVRFDDLRLYYDSLFTAAYHEGRIGSDHLMHYLTNFYMNRKHLEDRQNQRLPLDIPFPPQGTTDLAAFYDEYYEDTDYGGRPRIDSFAFVSYIMHYYMRDNFGPVVIPQGVVMGIGDNRDLSHDCRYWGFVPVEMLKGSPVTFYYSLGDEVDRNGRKRSIPQRIINTHWDRIGRVVR